MNFHHTRFGCSCAEHRLIYFGVDSPEQRETIPPPERERTPETVLDQTQERLEQASPEEREVILKKMIIENLQTEMGAAKEKMFASIQVNFEPMLQKLNTEHAATMREIFAKSIRSFDEITQNALADVIERIAEQNPQILDGLAGLREMTPSEERQVEQMMVQWVERMMGSPMDVRDALEELNETLEDPRYEEALEAFAEANFGSLSEPETFLNSSRIVMPDGSIDRSPLQETLRTSNGQQEHDQSMYLEQMAASESKFSGRIEKTITTFSKNPDGPYAQEMLEAELTWQGVDVEASRAKGAFNGEKPNINRMEMMTGGKTNVMITRFMGLLNLLYLRLRAGLEEKGEKKADQKTTTEAPAAPAERPAEEVTPKQSEEQQKATKQESAPEESPDS